MADTPNSPPRTSADPVRQDDASVRTPAAGASSQYVTRFDEGDERFNLRNGVFYPSGFALYAVPADGAQAGADAVVQAGIDGQDLTLFGPDLMKHIVERSREDASLLARVVGAELKQLQVLGQLAERGDHFMLIRAKDAYDSLFADLGKRIHASKGMLYHTLAVEELPVPKETIPENSPFGANEVIRTMPSDAQPDRN